MKYFWAFSLFILAASSVSMEHVFHPHQRSMCVFFVSTIPWNKLLSNQQNIYIEFKSTLRAIRATAVTLPSVLRAAFKCYQKTNIAKNGTVKFSVNNWAFTTTFTLKRNEIFWGTYNSQQKLQWKSWCRKQSKTQVVYKKIQVVREGGFSKH